MSIRRIVLESAGCGARSRGCLAIAVLAAAMAAGLAPAGAVAAPYPTVKLSSGLTPAFSRSVQDYVTSCGAGSVKVTVTVPSGVKASLDSKALTAGRTTTRTVRLAAGQRFSLTAGSGNAAQSHSIRCLPVDFPAMSPNGRLPSSTPFLGLAFPALAGPINPYGIIVDRNGTPVWWKQTGVLTVMDVKPAGKGLVGMWNGPRGNRELTDGPFSIYRLDGSKVRDVNVSGGYGDPHEAHLSPRGTWYRIAVVEREGVDMRAIGGPSAAKVFDQEIQEIDASGAVIWRWRFLDHVDVSESAIWFGIAKAIAMPEPFDVIHANSIDEDSQGGVIVSARHLDAIIRIRRSDGQIDWKLGGTPTSKSLSVLGESGFPARPLAMQHDARMFPDGTLTAYDNGAAAPGRLPRAVRWRVDPIARTATVLERLTDPQITKSVGGGSARRLPDGGWIVSWCDMPYVRAYSASGARLFDLQFTNSGYRRSYRAIPFSATDVTRTQLVAGMDAQYPRKSGG